MDAVPLGGPPRHASALLERRRCVRVRVGRAYVGACRTRGVTVLEYLVQLSGLARSAARGLATRTMRWSSWLMHSAACMVRALDTKRADLCLPINRVTQSPDRRVPLRSTATEALYSQWAKYGTLGDFWRLERFIAVKECRRKWENAGSIVPMQRLSRVQVRTDNI